MDNLPSSQSFTPHSAVARTISHDGDSFEQSQGCSSDFKKSLGGWDPVSSAQVTADTGVQLLGIRC